MGYDARYADRDARASLLDSQPAVCGMLASDGGNSKAVFMVEDLRTNSRLSEQEYYEITKDMMSNQLASLGATGVTQQQRTFLVEGKAHVGASLSGYVSGIQWQLTYILLKMDRYIGAFTILTPSQTEIDLLLSRSGITSAVCALQ